MDRKPPDGYDVAQVCPNGHVANATTIWKPEDNKPHCAKCGEKTMTACPKCQTPIQGYNWSGSWAGRYNVSAFCIHCGAAFPWTERQMEAAIELFLDATCAKGEEAETFKQSVQAVVKDTPQAEVAANHLARMLKKVGGPVADTIQKILAAVACEAAKRYFTGGH